MAITRIMSGQTASIGMGPPPWAKAGEITIPASLRPLKAPRALSSEIRPHALRPKGLQGAKCNTGSDGPPGGGAAEPTPRLHTDFGLDRVQDAKRLAHFAHVALKTPFLMHRLALAMFRPSFPSAAVNCERVLWRRWRAWRRRW